MGSTAGFTKSGRPLRSQNLCVLGSHGSEQRLVSYKQMERVVDQFLPSKTLNEAHRELSRGIDHVLQCAQTHGITVHHRSRRISIGD